jgi:hypothetical protein
MTGINSGVDVILKLLRSPGIDSKPAYVRLLYTVVCSLAARGGIHKEKKSIG